MKEVAGLGMLERGKFLVLTAEGDHPGAVVEVLGFTDDKIKVALIDLLDWFKPVDSLTTVEVPPSRLQFLTIEASIMEKGELLAEDANSDYIMHGCCAQESAQCRWSQIATDGPEHAERSHRSQSSQLQKLELPDEFL